MSKEKVGFVSINEKIAFGIKEGANDGAVDKVVAKRVDAEIQRRADLLEKGLDKYNTARKDLEKCKPDDIKYGVVSGKDGDEVGTPVKQEFYTEKRLKEKQNLQKLVADLDIAIMKAFSENDYSKLQTLVGGGSKPAGKPAEDAVE
jgi:Skp family chaperone for outer membrane proteins